jgi:hypothetical protein
VKNKLSIEEAQSNMRIGYANGFTGVLVSGTVWFITAMISWFFHYKTAICTLLIGGALINPISNSINKSLHFKGDNSDNPMKRLSMESTVWMMMCIPLAYGLSFQKPQWFFQGMLLIIAGRYLTFSTVFGQKIFWLLGLLLGMAALILFQLDIKTFGCLLVGAGIELAVGYILYLNYHKNYIV